MEYKDVQDTLKKLAEESEQSGRKSSARSKKKNKPDSPKADPVRKSKKRRKATLVLLLVAALVLLAAGGIGYWYFFGRSTPEPAQVTTAPVPTIPAELENSSSEDSDGPVYYLSRDGSVPEDGNAGKFAYSSEGEGYSLYCIIDFDEGFVYRFRSDSSDKTCDRMKIDRGDLNTGLTVTYHNGGDQWNYGLKFGTPNRPDLMVLIDNNGFHYDYHTTGLKDAMILRAGKVIIDY